MEKKNRNRKRLVVSLIFLLIAGDSFLIYKIRGIDTSYPPTHYGPKKVVDIYFHINEYNGLVQQLKKDKERMMYQRCFSDAIEHRIENTGSTMDRGDNTTPCGKGNDDGHHYFDLNRDKFKGITLEDYGYRYIETEGRYVAGFELSEFTDNKTGDKWWLKKIEGLKMPYLIGPEPIKMKIRGYLSPKALAGYGHFNGWDREIIIDYVEKTGE